ncbi:MAG: HD domain-containing protein [Clostridiaceae bacterium]|jgi:nicotinate-nucleotide adenylyltransferase|nr:HD domain-containing protein [Clostridiaceae bacterium]
MIGILGGAFDPVHNEHIELARAAAKELKLDALLVVPTFFPPHKNVAELEFADRAEILRRVFADFPVAVTVSDEEKIYFEECGGYCYTAEILPRLKKKYGDAVYIIGGDSFAQLESWMRPRDIIECAPVAVAARGGYENPREVKKRLFEGIFKGVPHGRVKLLRFAGTDTSSMVTRARLLANLPADIPEAAARYIAERGLFSRYKPICDKLKTMITAERYKHSLSVAVTAVEINMKCKLKQDFDKTLLAGLLHDCGKNSVNGVNTAIGADGVSGANTAIGADGDWFAGRVPLDAVGTKTEHQFTGAVIAEEIFGVTDKEILNAIRTHTTGAPDMTLLQRLMYTADAVEPLRDLEFADTADLRRSVFADFEGGFRATLKYTLDSLIARGIKIYPLTADAARYYLGAE